MSSDYFSLSPEIQRRYLQSAEEQLNISAAGTVPRLDLILTHKYV